MPYTHIEIEILQHAKRPEEPCGDVVAWEKNREATTLVLCDGLGSGVYANLAARFAAERLLTLIRQDFSPRDAFLTVAESMQQAKSDRGPYASLVLCRVLNDGHATLLAFEAPGAIALERQYAFVLPQRHTTSNTTVIAESHFHMNRNAHLLLVSDGITQAGMGKGLASGWQTSGVAHYVNGCFRAGAAALELPERIRSQAQSLDQAALHDDATVVMMSARAGNVVNVLSGPPADRGRDEAVARDFCGSHGVKVVCGATTALIVSRYLKRDLQIDPARLGYVEPPRYQLPGIELTTEGAITLNQACNLLDLEAEDLTESQSSVAALCGLLRQADRVNWIVGSAENPAHRDIRFRQMGIWPRARIIPEIADKLRRQGKLVVVETV